MGACKGGGDRKGMFFFSFFRFECFCCFGGVSVGPAVGDVLAREFGIKTNAAAVALVSSAP